ncbi:hypothetical protein GCM10027347_42800 [Larkinella harenae]
MAIEEDTEFRLCQIVDAHYFRGRLNAHEASQRGNQLFYDRLFDDILMSEGVVTHYLPVKSFHGSRQEKGIDVWLALETFELTISKKFDVVVLITADGDYVPLIRKLNTLGTRVMVLSWDFEYYNDEGEKLVTRTSQDLLKEVSYPVAMHEMIDTRLRKNDPLIQNLFVKQSTRMLVSTNPLSLDDNFDAYTDDSDSDPSEYKISTIRSLKNGYGFINYPPNNLFFHYTSLNDIDFNELQVDDEVKFRIGKNAESKDIAIDVHLEIN